MRKRQRLYSRTGSGQMSDKGQTDKNSDLAGRIMIRRYECPGWAGYAFGSNPPYGLADIRSIRFRFSADPILERHNSGIAVGSEPVD